MHPLFDASDLSKSNVLVTFKMFLKYQDRFVRGKYLMNLSLQLQFAYC